MPRSVPPELAALLAAPPGPGRDRAWSGFLRHYHRYLMGTARYLGRDYDGAMDRYRYVLEELRRDDFRRLRGYVAEQGSQFSTWLVVVVRRLCRDFERRQYGRLRESSSSETRESLAARRRLADLVTEPLDPQRASATHPDGISRRLENEELRTALRRAMEGLTEEDRLILKLRFEDDLPAIRIARVARLPSAFHVYRRLKRILSHMRERLDDSAPLD